MTRTPVIEVAGQGSRREAAELGQIIADGTARALAGQNEPLSIATLRVQVAAGASPSDIHRAIRAAIGRETRRGR